MFERRNNVLLAISASIAIYKALEVISLLKKRDFNIRVAMTREAAAFISPVVFEALTGSKVYVNVLEELERVADTNITHVALAEWADVFAVVPATSNVIAKLACGMSDDAVSLVGLATKAHKLIVPAMNTNMYLNPITQRNLRMLQGAGYLVVEPVSATLACGQEGKGHIADVVDIADAIETLAYPKPFEGKKIIVTASATREEIDPVRFISNRSTGKMGFAIAKAARMLGAQVKLITGPTHLAAPWGVECIRVNSAVDMLREARKALDEFGDAIVIMAAAIADFKPVRRSDHKIKKEDKERLVIELEKNPDVTVSLVEHARSSGNNVRFVGFAAETDDLLENATKKIEKKSLEFIVANDVSRSDIGFGSEDNQVTIIYKDGRIERLEKMSKERLAFEILRRLA